MGAADVFRQFEQGGFIKQRFGGGECRYRFNRLPVQFVNLALYPCEGIWEPIGGQVVDAAKLEAGAYLRPQVGRVHAGEPCPDVDHIAQGLSVVRRGRGEGNGAFNGHPVAVPLDDVEAPLAERLGDRRAGEHGEGVAAAEGEEAGTDGQIDRVEVFNHLRHIFGEFIGVAFVDAPNRIFILVTKRAGKF